MALNTTKDLVLEGKRFIGKNGSVETGTMVNNGTFSAELAPNNSADSSTKNKVTVKKGYHSGKGVISLLSIETATRDTDATSSDIYTGKTALVKGSIVTGVASISGVSSFSSSGSSDYAITVVWTNPSGGLYSGVRVVYKTGSYPSSETDGSYVDTVGTSTSASSASSVTLSGLSRNTTYYFRIYSYANVNGSKVFGSSSGTTSKATTCDSNCSCVGGNCYSCGCDNYDPCPTQCHCDTHCWGHCSCDCYGPGYH